MDTPAITELLMPLIACRSLKVLQAKTLQAMMACSDAHAVVVYLPEITGRKLVPLACDGGMPLDRLPELSTELGEQRFNELDRLYNEPFFYRHTSTPSRLNDLQLSLFGRKGGLAAHRLIPETSSNARKGHQAFAFLLSEPRSDAILHKDHQALHVVWEAFILLRPLLQSLEKFQLSNAKEVASSKTRRKQIDTVLSESLVGRSPQIIAVRDQISRYAQNNYSVLVQGETGTGKELVARALHRLSSFAKGPFIAENISALPDNLIESELFGYKKGAFTGADKDREGLVKRASGGTLFLDEIGDLSIDLQVKLLRVLQEKSVRPLGAEQDEPVNFRLVTATHVDLRNAISQGRFRADLFYRISQLTLVLPPLREREGDVEYLAQFFLQEIAVNNGDSAKLLSDAALNRVMAAEFKGNVRELQNCMIKAAFLSADNSVISEHDIELALDEGAYCNQSKSDASADERKLISEDSQDERLLQKHGLKMSVVNYEQRLLRQAYHRFAGDRGKMADFLRLPRRTLANKLSNFNCLTMEFDHDK